MKVKSYTAPNGSMATVGAVPVYWGVGGSSGHGEELGAAGLAALLGVDIGMLPVHIWVKVTNII